MSLSYREPVSVVGRSEARARKTLATAVAIAALALWPGRAAGQRVQAGEQAWRPPDLALAGAFALALWIDAAQTRDAVRRGYNELNPILGRHPTVGQVNTYTALTGLATLGVAAAVPARARPWFLAAACAVEVVAITGNVRAGLAVQF